MTADAGALKGWAAKVLAEGGVADARREAVLLLAHAARGSRAASSSAWAWSAGARDPVSPAVARRYRRLVALRAAGRPFAQVVGEREFFGLRLRVTRAVLAPRPETELLVEEGLAYLRSGGPLGRRPSAPGRPGPERLLVADLGTGSGALALAIASAEPGVQVFACDASQGALSVARANARRLGLARRVAFRLGDWWRAFAPEGGPGPRFACAVCNPPYLCEAEWQAAPPEVRAEPRSALVAGPTGLEAFWAVAREAPAYLEPGGLLAFEVGFGQAETVGAILRAHGFEDVSVRRDLAGIPRVVSGRLRPERAGGDRGGASRGAA